MWFGGALWVLWDAGAIGVYCSWQTRPRLIVLKLVFNHSVVFKFLYIFRVFVFLNFSP